MNDEDAERTFRAEWESPGSWFLQARGLYAAAQRLDPTKHPCRDDEEALSFHAEHDLLVGLAFENLLKGFIVLVRLELGHSPALPKECYVHELEFLASRSECAALEISADELVLFTRLSPYIIWAGCYPVPKKAKEMIVQAWSGEHEAEDRLWKRISPLLYERAWIMKGGPESMGGSKLFFKHSA